MAYIENDIKGSSIMETIIETGMSGISKVLAELINEAMELERQRHLKVAPYERSKDRQGYANGYKAKSLKSRVGRLELRVPQVREGDFYPSSLQKGSRSETALTLAVAEMYIQGMSTRRVSNIVEKLCGFEISSSEV